MAAGVLGASAVVYLIFGTGVEQPWAQSLNTGKKKIDTKISHENSAYASTDKSMDDVRNASR